ncbi:MAG TPA: hypothetical protein VGO47_14980 [Chlamydiales bacterium]|nr:hypothetical protein [Chlamydiales bacterium]
MPYNFTGCLAHIDLTYEMLTSSILRITGVLEHNSECNEQTMQRLPAIPIHPHVWEIALRQLGDGAR